MIAKAKSKYLRISPQKIRLIIALLKGMNTEKALAVLKSMNKKGAFYLEKVLRSAIANAKNKGFKEDKLFISKVTADPGPVLKRYRAASFGRATTIRKRTSHVLIELDTKEETLSKTNKGR